MPAFIYLAAITLLALIAKDDLEPAFATREA